MSSTKQLDRSYDVITDDMRRKLVVRHFVYGLTIRQAANDVGIKYYTARYVVKRFREISRSKGVTSVRPLPLDLT